MFPKLTPYFEPGAHTDIAIIAAVATARVSVLVQAYSFTAPALAQALIEAHRRQVQVRIILDDSNSCAHHSCLATLHASGMNVLIDHMHAIAHNKVMIIDSNLVITGSYNFTHNAEEHNAENCLFIEDPVLAACYTRNFFVHAGHSLRA